jgi:hypothetical protein
LSFVTGQSKGTDFGDSWRTSDIDQISKIQRCGPQGSIKTELSLGKLALMALIERKELADGWISTRYRKYNFAVRKAT